jgi:DNA-binding NarL/FixJ family response regulator
MRETKKILIVEDDEIISQVIEWRLKNVGYTVSGKASTGEDAITLTEETSPDAILMDIALKGDMDGIETAKIIKEKFNIPIIFLTASSDEKTLNRVIPFQPAQYILKPFNDDDLRIALRLSLSGKQNIIT